MVNANTFYLFFIYETSLMKTGFANFYSLVINWSLLYYRDSRFGTFYLDGDGNAFMSYDDKRKFYNLMENFLLTPPFREDSRGL